MENEVQKQTSPAPEGAPACNCGCGGKSKLPTFLLLLIIAAAVACLFIFDVFGQPLPKYAPEGTDVIAYTNYAKISQTKVWAAFKTTPAYKQMEADAKEKGFTFDKLEQWCIFVEMNGDAPLFNIIASGKDGFAEELFGKAKEEFEKERAENKSDAVKYSNDDIEGKQALVERNPDESKNVAMILVDKDSFQLTLTENEKFAPALLKPTGIELAKAVDTGALMSIAYKFELPKDAKAALEAEGSEMFRVLADKLDMVSLNLYDAGDDIEFKLEAAYETPEAAKKAEEQVSALRTMGATAMKDENPKAAAVLDSVKIDADGKQLTVSLKYAQSELAELIKE